MTIEIPEHAGLILTRLEEHGYEAYVVGGCVRDALLNRECGDTDVTTSATPEQICEVFSDCKLLLHGIKHGTVTVIIDRIPTEITTFRSDGNYTDCRHPDSVCFTSSLSDDLCRRDFTINAMCYSDKSGIVDEFDGVGDINKKLIRTVGCPDERFNEDALRIMRALRFASVLGFDIEQDTSDAIMRNKHLLSSISAERLFAELTRLITGKDACRILLKYGEVLGVFIPDILPAIGFNQYGKKHCYTVWEHICHTVDAVPAHTILRLTMLLHDLGKVPTAALNEKGDSTFKNHAAVGAQMAEKTLRALRADNATLHQVVFYIDNHDFEIPVTLPQTRRLLSRMTAEQLQNLLLIKTSDRGALSEEYRDVSNECASARENIRLIQENGLCCTLGELAVNGRHLNSVGITGEDTGEALKALLNAVIDDACPNEKQALLDYAASAQK